MLYITFTSLIHDTTIKKESIFLLCLTFTSSCLNMDRRLIISFLLINYAMNPVSAYKAADATNMHLESPNMQHAITGLQQYKCVIYSIIIPKSIFLIEAIILRYSSLRIASDLLLIKATST